MLHKEFWGLLFLAFVAWIILASNPSQRIENACRPVHWAGNVVVSVSALVLPTQQVRVQAWFDKFEYGCRYTTWRLFYQEEYNAWLRSMDEAAQAKAPQQDPLTGSKDSTAPAAGDEKAPTSTEKPADALAVPPAK